MSYNFEKFLFKNIKELSEYKSSIQKYNISEDELKFLYFRDKDYYMNKKIKNNSPIDITFMFDYDSYNFDLDEIEENEKKIEKIKEK